MRWKAPFPHNLSLHSTDSPSAPSRSLTDATGALFDDIFAAPISDRLPTVDCRQSTESHGVQRCEPLKKLPHPFGYGSFFLNLIPRSSLRGCRALRAKPSAVCRRTWHRILRCPWRLRATAPCPHRGWRAASRA